MGYIVDQLPACCPRRLQTIVHETSRWEADTAARHRGGCAAAGAVPCRQGCAPAAATGDASLGRGGRSRDHAIGTPLRTVRAPGAVSIPARGGGAGRWW
jgi:hypothetical protein